MTPEVDCCENLALQNNCAPRSAAAAHKVLLDRGCSARPNVPSFGLQYERAAGGKISRTPFLEAGLGASLRFSTMNPFLRPTARPVLSIWPGIAAAYHDDSELEQIFFLARVRPTTVFPHILPQAKTNVCTRTHQLQKKIFLQRS